jgi:hypothetical protein
MDDIMERKKSFEKRISKLQADAAGAKGAKDTYVAKLKELGMSGMAATGAELARLKAASDEAVKRVTELADSVEALLKEMEAK